MEKHNQTDTNQKRPRDPLEDILVSNELENVMKKRCLAAEGVENQNPLQLVQRSPARPRQVELEVKPDTPAIASVRLRVQQLAQKRDGGVVLVQRCMSDPGKESPSRSLLHDICHIGEGEFSSRLECFKTPTPESSPVPSTSTSRQLSSFVHNMQQQLHAAVTPSTKEASRIRQARKDELKLLRVQPLSENMWLKRSLSDPSLAEDNSSIDSKGTECCLSFSSVNEAVEDFSGEIQPSCSEFCPPEAVVHCKEEMSTSALIDKMFEDVLQAADKEEEAEKRKEETRGNESSLSQTIKGEETDMVTAETQPKEESLASSCEGGEVNTEAALHSGSVILEHVKPSEGDEMDELPACADHSERGREIIEEGSSMCSEEDFLTLPPSCVLSPLSKSMEAVVTPLRLVATAHPPKVQCVSLEELTIPPAPPLYSIDAYRSQSKNSHLASQCVTPGVQKQAPEKSCSRPAINTKETIKVLNEDAAKLQTIINQTLQALSCCSDREHGKGSLQEAEAEKLLLVSSEKHAALLAEISRLREGAGAEADPHAGVMQPCRGTVSISSVQLPLKVEFVCSARTGRPAHYFFILLRYGTCNIVATPLATAADAENGDTITFPTSITLQDIRSNFEIDVEVYSLSSGAGNPCTASLQQHRSSTRSRVTPKKLLSTLTKSNPSSSSGPPLLSSRRSSNFCLVGSHKITLASLGQSRFPLDKMKFEGKVRRLLGDEFQEKVPFLSPLEGHIYLQLHNESHSNVQHQGFLTMFEDVSGFGAWQRLFFRLEGALLFYWNYPNEMGSKPAEGSVSLCCFDSVRPVERETCARPHTFELVNTRIMKQVNSHSLNKSWFSADTREERADWMEKLSQVLLDFHTWSQHPASSESDRANSSSNTRASRESVL
ncbi:anillin isoform X1 [Electrophorus electricus]|uniref:PH domain-containing protein n=1 Tax=Electrophorus electricus TaxID=8005 RepID=A0A4W4EPV5_ELEEL|nr:anillin isoform X1 [Electrophorus electricus]